MVIKHIWLQLNDKILSDKYLFGKGKTIGKKIYQWLQGVECYKGYGLHSTSTREFLELIMSCIDLYSTQNSYAEVLTLRATEYDYLKIRSLQRKSS